MGADSKIQWTTHTFNPWIGCTKVSDGCKNCYAESYDKRVRGLNGRQPRRWGPTAARERTSPANWRKPLQWDAEAKKANRRDRVFCASLADVFDDHPSVEPQWRVDLFALIEKTPHLDWLLLTKRPEKAADWMGGSSGAGLSAPPIPNAWWGTTVENQEQARKRIPWLLEIPARVRFLSMEPLLEGVDLERIAIVEPKPPHGPGAYLNALTGHIAGPDDMGPRVDWVIVGGESGPGARPFDLRWARDIQRQCRSAGVAFFCKQLGSDPRQAPAIPVADERPMLHLKDRKGGDWSEWPADLRVRELPEVSP